MDIKLEVKAHEREEDRLCDSKVVQYSGYFKIGNTKKNYFFWFFESRNKPDSDPLVMWLTGGPGCSSELALFAENGPCTTDGTNTKTNPYSWNTNANLLYVDQPSGTGFSYGGENDHNERDVSNNLYVFLTEFLRKYPKYLKLKFFLFGESYAGHYVPATAHRIWLGNKREESDIVINLKGVSVGNGMTNPLIQFRYYPEMAFNSKTTPQLVSESTYKQMKLDVPVCTSLIHLCLIAGGSVCDSALQFCETAMLEPVEVNGWNRYDARIKCEKQPLCYDFSAVDSYLNRKDIREKLGVPPEFPKWEECSNSVNRRFSRDWMHNFDIKIPDLVNNDIPVLIYAGDADYICNWLGNHAWVMDLKWKGKEGFNLANEVEWNHGAGKLRKYETLSFLQVYAAGHMVPMDQPKAALDMLNQFTSDGLEIPESDVTLTGVEES